MRLGRVEGGQEERESTLIVGIDLGGTKILAGLGNLDGNVRTEIRVETRAWEGPERVVARMVDTVRELMRQGGVRQEDISYIVLGAPGPLDPSTGVVCHPPNLPGWDCFSLRERLLHHFPKCSVVVDNDANLAALGEYYFGYERAFSNLLFVTVGTGIGGGIIMDGRIYHGCCGAAGEFGHMAIKPEDGPGCGCGARGCLEALASGTAITREARDVVVREEGSLMWELAGQDAARLTTEVLGEAARKGDEAARRIIAKAGFYLGIGLANLVNIFNPAAIILGGGVVFGLGEMLLGPAREEMKRRAMKFPAGKVQLLEGKLGSRAGLLGCFALAAQELSATDAH